MRGDAAPQLGAAFLALARGDSTAAAQQFVEAAARHPEAASALLLAAARIHAARSDAPRAIALWQRIVAEQADAPEAAEAELEWARALRRSGDAQRRDGASRAPDSQRAAERAPPAGRRELELLRGTVPPG